jgi:hypothetical protein
MTETGFPERGDVIECRLPKIDEHTKRLTFIGTVARTEPPEDGWEAGIVVDYPKLRYKKQTGVCVFHEWPNKYVHVIEQGA